MSGETVREGAMIEMGWEGGVRRDESPGKGGKISCAHTCEWLLHHILLDQATNFRRASVGPSVGGSEIHTPCDDTLALPATITKKAFSTGHPSVVAGILGRFLVSPPSRIRVSEGDH